MNHDLPASRTTHSRPLPPWCVVLVIACVCLPGVSMANMECGNRIISKGTSSAEMSAFCGPAAQVEKSTIYVGGSTTGTDNRVVSGATGEIQVEIWTYNFGPNKLMERVRLENGVVVDIKDLGYGYDAP